MATAYSSAYRQLGQSPSRYEPLGVFPRVAEIGWRNYFRYSMPVGQASADVIKLGSIFSNTPVATPQIQGQRLARFVLRSAGNVGGSVTINLGTSASPTLLGTALTTLQSAGTLDVPIATIMAAGPFLVNDDFQMVLTAGPSTTVQVIDGFYDIYQQTPVGA